jgi:hypothetical protein
MGNHPSAAPRLDPGVLAAFVDGTLDDIRRRQVLAILASSAPDRQVLADVARLIMGQDGARHPACPRRTANATTPSRARGSGASSCAPS